MEAAEEADMSGTVAEKVVGRALRNQMITKARAFHQRLRIALLRDEPHPLCTVPLPPQFRFVDEPLRFFLRIEELKLEFILIVHQSDRSTGIVREVVEEALVVINPILRSQLR